MFNNYTCGPTTFSSCSRSSNVGLGRETVGARDELVDIIIG